MNDDSPILAVVFLSFVALMCLFGGGVALIQAWRDRAALRKARRWPTTAGRILRSSVSREVDSDPDGVNISYEVQVLYEYTVGGVRHESSRIGHSSVTFSLRRSANAMLKRYPVGRAVAVYYDPDQPGSSLLEHRDDALGTLYWVGLTMPAVGLFFLYLTIRLITTRLIS